MIKLGVLLSACFAASASAVDFQWTKCTNAPHCTSQSPPGDPSTYSAVIEGDIVFSPGGYIFPYETSTGFTYAQSDGYWYSHDADGLYVSPTGYVHFAHDYNVVGLQSKDGNIGVTYWKNFGAPCCLPDSVGTDIYNAYAFKTDSF